jgi:hypothetical protein
MGMGHGFRRSSVRHLYRVDAHTPGVRLEHPATTFLVGTPCMVPMKYCKNIGAHISLNCALRTAFVQGILEKAKGNNNWSGH